MGDLSPAAPSEARPSRLRQAGRLILEHLAFNSPRARTLNLAGIVVLAAAVPTDRLHWLPVRSVWENVFGVRLYSSGLTRALSRLFHGDLEGAWAFNPLVFVVAPLILFLIAWNAWRWREAARSRRPGPAGA